MILSVMHTPNGNLLELCVDGGVYTTRLYQYVEDSEREIGLEEAKDLQAVVRRARAFDVDATIVADVR